MTSTVRGSGCRFLRDYVSKYGYLRTEPSRTQSATESASWSSQREGQTVGMSRTLVSAPGSTVWSFP
ncbi:hypothetical protein BDV93DRAFT_527135 [Ceratobasidium sp. AG-I]|nr:hypothetical protein BDV93DRAFT_527135 [Ceratobasidium sp. AG-I]